MPEGKMREDFEAWHRSKYATRHCTGQPTRDMHNGVKAEKYGPPHEQERWEIWQASRAAVVVELPDWFSPNDCGDRAYWDDLVHKAIEAAGVRIKE